MTQQELKQQIQETNPWLSFSGEAGTLEYATQTRDFLEQAFGGVWTVSVTPEGWHYSEEKKPA